MCQVKGCVPMRGPFDAAKLDVVSSTRGAYIHREGSFQQDLMLMPIQPRAEINARGIAIDRQPLDNGCIGKAPRQAQYAAQRSTLFYHSFGEIVQLAHLVLVKDIELPGFAVDRA